MTPRALLESLLRFVRPARPRDYRGLRGRGQAWERLAAKRLEAEGYRILDRNFRARAGEIDFVAEEKGVLCFVEVKGRSGRGFGLPAEAVTLEKQRRIFRAAEEYVRRRRRGPCRRCRFDVVSILEADGGTDVVVLRGAFEEPPPRRRPR
ncbi:MAG TPA: YraN family protein [Thermoanaerobaculia bacterium]|nr:YraN family protein [Thermoanaerobaculia bacterium]